MRLIKLKLKQFRRFAETQSLDLRQLGPLTNLLKAAIVPVTV